MPTVSSRSIAVGLVCASLLISVVSGCTTASTPPPSATAEPTPNIVATVEAAVAAALAKERAKATPTPSDSETVNFISGRVASAIVGVNMAMPEGAMDLMSRANSTQPMAKRYRAKYYYDLATLGRQDYMLGHYLRYMAPLLKSFSDGHEFLLEDRYLTEFAHYMALGKLPPAMPNIDDRNWERLCPPGATNWLPYDTWPYSAGGAAMFGDQ